MKISQLDSISINRLKPTNGGANAELSMIPDMLWALVDWALTLFGIVAFFMIAYSAFLYFTSYGDQTKMETAKKTLFWAIFGVIIIALSAVILGTIKATFK